MKKEKLRCTILDDYQKIASKMADWSSISEMVETTFFHQRFENEVDLIKAIANCEIVVIMRERTPFGEQLLKQLPNLELLVTTGPRNVAIDLEAAKAQGIEVCGTATAKEPPVELTWALILGLCRKIVQENNAFRSNGPWQKTIGVDLKGKRLGILGLGNIGSKVAQIGQAFGMEVMAWSQNLTKEKAESQGVALAVSKEELLETSDVVSIHLILSKRTKGLLGERELKRMRPSAFLINTSRAPIVEEPALVKALKENWIAGAGLDVFETEPVPYNHPFRNLTNVLATPHLGYVSEDSYKLYYGEALEDIKAYLEGNPIRSLF
ncbi:D-2-hydroxyacid dehydrogenase family protein [Cytophagales bacterium RKSG123]|nr:D-2-hydroxyacid dehydrogenase family protein [Xanthovirga aplysinae]